MARDLLIRSATAGDTGRIVGLMKLCLGEGKIPRRPEYWAWKHVDNPFGESPCLVAEADGCLVGLRVFMRWTLRAGAEIVPTVRAVDTATHPEWRGRGIFSRLTLALVDQMKADGVAFVFNTPNNQSRPGYLKMGWRSIGHTSGWVRPVAPFQAIGSMLSRTSRRTENQAPLASQVGAAASDFVEQPWLPRFLAMLPVAADRFSTPRTLEYFRWRYVAIPGFEYRAAWHIDDGHGAAVIFRFKDHSRMRELRLCEVLVGRSRESMRMSLKVIRSVVRGAAAHYATAMAVSASPERRALLRAGFLPAPRMGPVMTVRVLNGWINSLDPLRRADWDLSIGDLELF